ncbi:MAG TPA: hypothetical protein VGI22_17595 [Xanthobacteraceae bacterium]
MSISKNRLIVVEDDPFARVVGILLDPTTAAERYAAYADFFAHDDPDFDGYVARVRARIGGLFPSPVKLVETPEEMRTSLPGARAVIVESLPVGPDEIAAGVDLVAVQKYGAMPRNIDAAACAARGIKLLTFRRRANIACAELAITLMLTLAKKMHRLAVGSARSSSRPRGTPTSRSTATTLPIPTGRASPACASCTTRPWASSGSAGSGARSRCGRPRSGCGSSTINARGCRRRRSASCR